MGWVRKQGLGIGGAKGEAALIHTAVSAFKQAKRSGQLPSVHILFTACPAPRPKCRQAATTCQGS